MPLFGRKKKYQDFTLSLNPVMGNIPPGGSASATITVNPRSSETAAVNLSAGVTVEGGGLPAGVNVSFNPPLGVPPFSSAINVSASPELAPGVYPFLVIAAGVGMKQLATYTLIVRSKTAVKKPASEGSKEQTSER